MLLHFYELQHSIMSTCLITEVVLCYISTWMGDRPRSRPHESDVSDSEFLLPDFNSSALLVILMALQLAHVDQNIVFVSRLQKVCAPP